MGYSDRFVVFATSGSDAGLLTFAVESDGCDDIRNVGVPVAWSVEKQYVYSEPSVVVLPATPASSFASLWEGDALVGNDVVIALRRDLEMRGVAAVPIGTSDLWAKGIIVVQEASEK